jgi:hypothetical protein
LVALVGQAIAGHADYSNEQIAHMSEPVSCWRYIVSSDFGQAVMENWQSEYLQFTLFLFATVWFVQKGSPESKNAEQREHHESTVDYGQYLGTADFWETTLQNWRSEFLAVGSMAVLAIYLRQRGSPESKPVGAAHEVTGIEG